MRFCYSIAQNQCNRIPTLALDDDTGFEIRLDTFTQTPDPQALRASTSRPLLATFRSKPHLGVATLEDRNQRGWELRLACLKAGFDMVDLELDEPHLEDKISRIQEEGGRVVLSHHELEDNSGLEEAFQKALRTRADIIKIIGTGRQTTDLLDQRRRYQQAQDRSLVHFYMGAEFAATRVLSLIYGKSFTFLTPNPETAIAPGQLTFQDVTEIYQPLEMEGLSLFAVIGAPIGHSRSPLFHNPGLKKTHRNNLFLALHAKGAEDLATLRTCFPELRGMAVTKPMKEVAFQAVTGFLDQNSSDMGAVNTLIFQDHGLKGANTDLLAMIELLKKQTPGMVRILGYGGLGKAVARACASLGLPAQVCNRTPGRVSDLPENVVEIPWSQRHEEGPSILVQATSAGMAPHEESSPLEIIPKSVKVLVETIYNPIETKLMTMARKQELIVLDGMALFNGQARIQHQFFQQASFK